MNEKAITTLRSLRQLDIDAVHAYTQAIEQIDVASICTRREQFRGDHERQITNLEPCIRRLGEEPEARGRDFKGFLIRGFTAVRSMTGTEGALKAMQGNEETTNEHYGEAMAVDFPSDIRAVVRRNNEKRHLAYVKKALAAREWEHAA